MGTPQTVIYQRHYVGDEKAVIGLERIVDRTLSAKQQDWGFGCVYGMLINYHPEMDKEGIIKQAGRLTEKNIEVISKQGYGVGSAFLEILQQSLAKLAIASEKWPTVHYILDGDQYEIDNPITLRAIGRLSEMVIEEDALLGLSARDRVELAEGDLNEKRQIEEMFHSLVIGKITVEETERVSVASVPSAYMHRGDPIPGCYGFNIASEGFTQLLTAIYRNSQKADLTKFAGDPYVVIRASRLGKIVSKRMPVPENPPGPFKLDNIRAKGVELGKTDIANRYLTVVQERGRETLSEFYGRDVVNEVADMIVKGIESVSGSRSGH